MTQPEARRTTVIFIFIAVLVDTVGLGIILPVTPELIMELSGQWLWFVYALMQFFCAPILGNLGDRIGRRPVILFSLLALGLDYLIMGFAPRLLWLFVGRTLAGMAGASYVPAYAYLADVSPPDRRAQNFGLVGAAFGIGFILGPAIGGLLGQFGSRTPFFVAAAFALANATFGYFVLPESLSLEARRPFEIKRANPFGTLMQMRKYPVVLGLAGTLFLWQLGHQSLPSTWAFYTMYKFGWSEAAVGASLAFVGIVMAVSQGLLTRVLIPRLTELRAARIGLLCGALAFFGYSFATQGWMMYAAMVLWLFAGLVYPSLNAIMSRQIPRDAQGELQGGVASLASIASIIGPLLMTHLFGAFTSESAPVRFPGAAFLFAAMLVIGASLLFLRATHDTLVSDDRVAATGS
jgi:MFS transporter, DHA1 family, tetracycline resistance protein